MPRSRVVIVAVYTGNAPLEFFQTACGNEHWKALNRTPRAPAVICPRYLRLLTLWSAGRRLHDIQYLAVAVIQ